MPTYELSRRWAGGRIVRTRMRARSMQDLAKKVAAHLKRVGPAAAEQWRRDFTGIRMVSGGARKGKKRKVTRARRKTRSRGRWCRNGCCKRRMR